MTQPGRLVVLAAPSGAGKTTIAQALVAQRSDVEFSVSATTRAPRPGERNGQHYHFLSRAEFDRRMQAGDFLEWAEYLGNRYGTLRQEVDRILHAGHHVLLEIEVQGAAQVRRAYPWPDSVAIFLLPPSGPELVRRLTTRGTDGPEERRRRLEQARRELTRADEFDFVIVNDDVDGTLAQVSRAIDTRSAPQRPPELTERLAGLLRDLHAEGIT